MTEATILSLTVALVTGIPPTIMALAAYRQSRAAALAAAKTEVKTEAIAAKVDGAASDMLAENKALRREIVQMISDKAERKEEASLLAQAKVAADQSAIVRPAETPAITGPSPAASLVQIDKNTEETARNTARTEATVQDLKDKA